MKPESLLPCSPEHATEPLPEPEEFTCRPPSSFKINLNIIPPCMFRPLQEFKLQEDNFGTKLHKQYAPY